jgi:hypothetical protein
VNYLDLIYQIPAAVTASTAIAYALPFSLPARFNPVLLFLCALMVLSLTVKIDIALAICGPISLIHNYLGVRLQGHEPVKIPWRRSLAYAQEFRDRMKKTEVREFLSHPYPDPEEDPGPVAEDPSEVAVIPVGIRKFVPEL